MEVEKSLASGKAAFIHGHLGSGKTELAFHVSRKLLKDRMDLVEKNVNGEIVKDERYPLIVSGSRHTTLGDLYGHNVLDVSGGESDKNSEREFISEMEQMSARNNVTEKEWADFYKDWFEKTSL